MPSTILSAASGSPFPLVSGNLWSGQGAFHPVGGVRLLLDPISSGNAYISLSGGATTRSGGFFLSGGLTDGMLLAPGGDYFIPKLAFVSGQMSIWATCDPAASGQGRLYWETF